MARKRKSKSRKNSKKEPIERSLPVGFWPQTGAVTLIAFSILLVVSWFGFGGPAFDWALDFLKSIIGLASYILPFVLIYIAIQIFKSEDNKLSLLMKFTSVLLVLWVSGLTGLFRQDGGATTGGVIGDGLNTIMLSLVNVPVGVMIYVLLTVATLFAMIGVTYREVFGGIKNLFSRQASEDVENNDIMRKAAGAEKSPEGFKLNAGVPTLSAKDRKKEQTSAQENQDIDKDGDDKAMLSVTDPNWKFPGLGLLEKKQSPADAGDIELNARIIHDTLEEFNINVHMEGANIGPKVTQYMLSPPAGIKLSKITGLENNIALRLGANSLRMEAPIPGQKAVGIEVPNRKAADVRLRGILDSNEWRKAEGFLNFAIGKDITGAPVVGELSKMPHLLIAGQTGSGKSVMINALLCSLLYRNSPSDMKLVLVDPKQVEMLPYQDIPHLLTPVIVEPEKTISALKWAVNEMERRYSLLAEERVRDIKSYNDKVRRKSIDVADDEGHIQQVDEGKMPYIVIVIDELADLMMMAAKDVESLIVRIAQKARAVGIHLVLATQRPSVNVITGLIKANVPARIAFTVVSQVDSKTILDQAGAEKLLGQGDMLIKTATAPKPKRIQGAWVTDEEVGKITDHLRMQSAPQYNDEIISQPVSLNGKGGITVDFGGGDDSLFGDACRLVIEMQKASTSLLQRKLKIGYGRAARIIEEMEEQGVVGPSNGSKPREVLLSSLDEIDTDIEV